MTWPLYITIYHDVYQCMEYMVTWRHRDNNVVIECEVESVKGDGSLSSTSTVSKVRYFM